MNKIRDLPQKAAILLSPDNRNVRDAFARVRQAKPGELKKYEKAGADLTTREIYDEVLGLTDESLKKYASGQDSHAPNIASNLANHIADSFNIEITGDQVKNLDAIEFGARFGMRREETQLAMDRWIDGKPRPNNGLFLDDTLSNYLFRLLDGVYYIYMPCTSADHAKIKFVRAHLRVRYVFNDSKASKAYSIRCKLNMPSLNEPSAFFGYNGKVIQRQYGVGPPIFHWYFEQLPEGPFHYRELDHISMTTRVGLIEQRDKRPVSMTGLLQSISQDKSDSIYAAPVYIEWQSNIPSDFRKHSDTTIAVETMRENFKTYASLKELAVCSQSGSNAANFFAKNAGKVLFG